MTFTKKNIVDMKEEYQPHFVRNNLTDKIWWVDNSPTIGDHLFSFDKKNVFNLFRDYPYKLTKAQKAVFDSENPEWADFFKDRK